LILQRLQEKRRKGSSPRRKGGMLSKKKEGVGRSFWGQMYSIGQKRFSPFETQTRECGEKKKKKKKF